MKIYVRVAELSSFVRAAENLGMSKANISNAIQQLESSMGTRLLHRTTRKVQMTQDGLIFYERCKDLLAEVDEVESLFTTDASALKGRIRVDMPGPLARNFLIPRLPDFLSKYPGIEVELSSTDRKVDPIQEGFDCVIRVGSSPDSGLIARNLGHMTLVNCASAEYIKRYGKPKSIEDLSEHQLIHYSPILGAKPDGFEYHDGEKYRTKAMKGRVTVNNSDAYLASCLAGFGIVQIPMTGIKDHLKNKTLIEVLPQFKAEPMPVSLIYPHRRNLARRVQVFMDWVEKILKGYVV